jgi:DNA replicative helicase MCM subunit Mcm2 (Cdc46/Mcm family)
MSVLIGGESSGGKSYLLKQLIKTLPDSMVVELQSVSNMGLAYMGKDALKRKFLALYELGGLGKEGSEAIEQLKQLLTEGCIRRQIAESTNKGVGGRTVELDGPTGVWSTSMEMRIDKELGNRLFRISIDESPEQTRRIIKARG